MVINNENIHEVNNISLHDACFESFVFDRVHNRLETVVKPEWPFVVPPDFDVIGTEMSNCEYWGASPYVFSLSILNGKKSHLVQRLFENMKPEYKFCKLKSKDDYIEVLIEFSSGDKLRVACSSVRFGEAENDE